MLPFRCFAFCCLTVLAAAFPFSEMFLFGQLLFWVFGFAVRLWPLPSSSMRDICSCVSALPLSPFFLVEPFLISALFDS
jgi:hypothetical protein